MDTNNDKICENSLFALKKLPNKINKKIDENFFMYFNNTFNENFTLIPSNQIDVKFQICNILNMKGLKLLFYY